MWILGMKNASKEENLRKIKTSKGHLSFELERDSWKRMSNESLENLTLSWQNEDKWVTERNIDNEFLYFGRYHTAWLPAKDKRYK